LKDSYDFSDTGNAQLLNDLFGKDIRYDPKTSRWLRWTNSHRWYEMDATEQFRIALEAIDHRFDIAKLATDKTEATKQVGFAIRSRNLNNLKNMLEMSGNLPPIGNHTIQWDNQPNLLAVGNGVVNLSTSQIRLGQRNDFLSRGLALPYLPAMEAPTWERFLDDITLHNQELKDFLQLAIGYTLTGFTTAQVFFLLFGDGSNGKSVLTEILNELLAGFTRTVRFSAFEENAPSDTKRDIAELPGIRAAFASEGAKSSKMDTSIIKEITGGTPIMTSRKYGHPFEFKPQFKLWLTTNNLPRVDDESFGFWRRVIVIPFNAKFEGRTRDDHMKAKLIAELPGILAWAIRGAAIWSKIGLNTPDSLLLRVTEYREAEDTFEAFLRERCNKHPNTSIRANIFYEAYTVWCEENELKPVSNHAFGRKMSVKFEKSHDRDGWFYQGVELVFKP